MEPVPAWNSLEVVKLVVAGLTPTVVVLAGFLLNRRLKALEAAQWAQQKVIERRIQAYDQLAPGLNDIYCFFSYIGAWKNFSPPEIVARKRGLDKAAHVSAPVFDGEFLRLYNALVDRCFTTFNAWGTDATLRTLPDRRRQACGARWNDEWDACFDARERASRPSDVRVVYAEFMAYLGGSIGATQVDAHLLGTSRIPVAHDSGLAAVTSRVWPDG